VRYGKSTDVTTTDPGWWGVTVMTRYSLRDGKVNFVPSTTGLSRVQNLDRSPVQPPMGDGSSLRWQMLTVTAASVVARPICGAGFAVDVIVRPCPGAG
jgi:hypothetical protein